VDGMVLQVQHSGLRVGWCGIIPEPLKHLDYSVW